MFVIVIIIFVWPHTSLVHPYDLQKTGRTETSNGVYNPWYTKQHYVTPKDIDDWKLVRDTIGVEKTYEEIKAEFDERSYYSFYCEHFKKLPENNEFVLNWEIDNQLPFVCSLVAADEYDPKYSTVIEWAKEQNEQNPFYPWSEANENTPTQKSSSLHLHLPSVRLHASLQPNQRQKD